MLQICGALFREARPLLFYVVLLKKRDAHASIGCAGLLLQQYRAVVTFSYCGTTDKKII